MPAFVAMENCVESGRQLAPSEYGVMTSKQRAPGMPGRGGGADDGDVVVLVADLRDDPVEEGFGAVGGVGAVDERRVAGHVGGGGVGEHVEGAQLGE